jgi:hypothetical protein
MPFVCYVTGLFLLIVRPSTSFGVKIELKSRHLRNKNALHILAFSDKYRHSWLLLSICAGGGLGRELLAAISPHDVGSSCAQCHQRRAGQTKRLQETNEHRRKSGSLNTRMTGSSLIH